MSRPSTLWSEADARMRVTAASLSLVISIGLSVLKFWAYNETRSQAIFSDALESLVNIIAAMFGLFVIYYATKPADEDHPYGHGKAEFLSSTFEGGLIAFAAFAIIYESIKTLVTGTHIEQIELGINVTWITGVINLALGFFLRTIGKQKSSAALEANGLHVLSDAYTSFGIILGLYLVRWTGILWLDPVIAIVFAAWLAFSGVGIVRKAIDVLMDAEDPEILKQLATVFEKHRTPGTIQIHHAKVIRSGPYHHIDAHIVVPEFWNVQEVHRELDRFEHKVIESYAFNGEMNFHVDPCRRVYCDVCAYEPCPVRQQPFTKKIPVMVEDLRSTMEPELYLKRRT